MTETCIYATLFFLSVVATVFSLKNEFLLLGGIAFLMVYVSLGLTLNQLTNKEPHTAEVTSVELDNGSLEIRTDDGQLFLVEMHEGMDLEDLQDSAETLVRQIEEGNDDYTSS